MTGNLFSDVSFLSFLLLSTGCLAVGLAASYLLRRRAARAHHVLLVAMLAAIAVPAMWLAGRHYGLGVLTTSPQAQESSVQVLPPVLDFGEPAAPTEAAYVDDAPAVYESLAVVQTENGQPTIPWRALGLLGWLAASAVLLVRLIVRFALGVRLVRRSQRPDDPSILRAVDTAQRRLGVQRQVRVRTSGRISSPVIWCWSARPVLLVPESTCKNRASVDWASLFCHELAHWLRLDHVAVLYAELVACMLPWHPLVWCVKRRMVCLSEQACDDWVLACGQAGADYAESLLNVSAGPQAALLPAVAPSRRGMKGRIPRILTENGSNPRIGIRWTVVMTSLAVCLAVGAAFAQRRPARSGEREIEIDVRERGRRDEPDRRLAEIREQLRSHLRMLVEQAHQIESQLERLGDRPGPEAELLRFALDVLRDHIGSLEERLGMLAPGSGPERLERDLPPQVRELRQHVGNLEERAHEVELELGELEQHGQGDSDRAHELRRAMEEIRAQIEEATVEMHSFAAGHDEHAARTRGHDAERHLGELMRKRDELLRKAQQIQRKGDALREQDPDLVEGLHTELMVIDRQIEPLRRAIEYIELDLPRPEREMWETQAQEVMREREALLERARQIEQEIKTQPDNPDARAELREIHGRIERINQEMEHMERQRRPGDERPEQVLEPRQAELQEEIGQLERRSHEMQQQLRDLEQQGQGDSDPAHHLRQQLREVNERMRGLRREPRDLEDDRRGRRRPRSDRRQPDRDDPVVRGLGEQIARVEGELIERRQQLAEGHPELVRLRNVLDNLRERMQEAERQATRGRRARPGPEVLERKLGELAEKAQAIERELERLEPDQDERAAKLQAELGRIHDLMAATERELHAARERRAPGREQRRRPQAPPQREPRQRLAQLERQAHEIEIGLRELGDSQPERAGQLEAQLRALHERMEAVRAERPGPERRPNNLQHQVQELRGDVDRLHKGMEEIRALLDELLEASKTEGPGL